MRKLQIIISMVVGLIFVDDSLCGPPVYSKDLAEQTTATLNSNVIAQRQQVAKYANLAKGPNEKVQPVNRTNGMILPFYLNNKFNLNENSTAVTPEETNIGTSDSSPIGSSALSIIERLKAKNTPAVKPETPGQGFTLGTQMPSFIPNASVDNGSFTFNLGDKIKPSALQAPVKLSLDATTVPADTAILTQVQKSAPGDITRFAQAIGISDLFSSIIDRPIKIEPAAIIQSYITKNPNNSFDPFIALTNDIDALTSARDAATILTSTAYRNNLNAAIIIAQKALEQMPATITTNKTKELLTEALPKLPTRTGTLSIPKPSIYSVVKEAEQCVIDANETVTSLEGQNPTALTIAQQYHTIYTQVYDALQAIQAQAIQLEGDRLSADQMRRDSNVKAKELVDGLKKSNVPTTEKTKQVEVLKQAQAQVTLDIALQDAAEKSRKPKETALVTKLSPTMDPQDKLASIKKVLADLLQDLGTKNEFILDVQTAISQLNADNLRTDTTKNVVGIVDQLQKIVSDATETYPDFAEFLTKTETLQIYAHVIDTLLTKMEDTEHKQTTANEIASLAEVYAKTTTDTISEIETKLAKLKTNTFSQADKSNMAGVYRTISNADLPAFYKELLKQLKVMNANAPDLALTKVLVASIKKEAQDPASQQHDPIVIALKQLQAKLVGKLASVGTEVTKILNTYNGASDKIVAAKNVAIVMGKLAKSSGVKTLLNDVIAKEIAATDFSLMAPETPIEFTDEGLSQAIQDNKLNPVMLYSDAINQISTTLTEKNADQSAINDLVGSLRSLLDIHSDVAGTITRKKIDVALDAIKNLNSSSDLTSVIKTFNEGLPEYTTIPDNTTFAVLKGTLEELSKESKQQVEKTFVYKVVNPVVRPFVDAATQVQKQLTTLFSAEVAAEKNNLDATLIKKGVTVAEVENSVHSFTRALFDTSLSLRLLIGAALASPPVVGIILMIAQMLVANQNSDDTQEEKDRKRDEILVNGLEDIVNQIGADITGADVGTIQSRDAEAIALEAILNSITKVLDPGAKDSSQYDPVSKKPTTNLDKLKKDINFNPPKTVTKRPPKNSKITYPSFQDLLDMENENQLSSTDSSSYTPSSPYAPKNYKQPVTLPVTSKKTYPSYQDLLDMENDGSSSYDPYALNAGG